MLSANDKARLRQCLQAEESKIVTIVLADTQQVAGEIEHAGINGITLTDGRRYDYADIREINGID